MWFFITFLAMAVLHFGGIVTLPLWLVFAPIVAWLFIILFVVVGYIWLK